MFRCKCLPQTASPHQSTSQVPWSQTCSSWSACLDACLGTHTPMRPVQSLPQRCQVERWGPAPTKGAHGKSRTHGGGFLPGLEDAQAEMQSPSSGRGAAPRASCLFGCGGRTSSSSQKRKQAAVASQPMSFPGLHRQLAGRRQKRQGGRHLLPERTGRVHSCGGGIESSPNSFAANGPPSPKSLAPYMCL